MSGSDALYLLVLLGGLYFIPVALSVGAAMFLLRGTAAKIGGFEWAVLYAPLVIWYLLIGVVPHWSGKSMSNLIESLILGLLIALITLARGYLGRTQPSRDHSRWYLWAIFLSPVVIWLVVPGLPE